MSKLTNWLKKAEKAVSHAIPHQHSEDRRAANQAVSEQIEFYKQQRNDIKEEKNRVEEERKEQKNKIAKKQIRSARHAYRAPGFMDEAVSSYGDTLG